MQNRFYSLFLLFFIAIAIAPTNCRAAEAKYLFKIGSLAPEGSVWARRFSDFTKEVSAKTNGEVAFKIYAGGVMGDDRAMYRKMRVGQLQGGGFTMTGISEVVGDFRILGIPFLFKNYDEVDRVIAGIFPTFQKEFNDNGLELLAMSEVGFIYTMSSKPVTSIAALRQSKSWAPENDPVSQAFLKTIGVTPIPLTIPDVLSSLQTGLIDTVYNSLYGAIVMQWFTRTNYLTDVPFGYAYGGVIFSKAAFDKLPPAYAATCRDLAKKHFGGLLADTRKSNEEALVTLKKNGVKLVSFPESDLAELRKYRDQMVQGTSGNAFSREIYDEAVRLLGEARKNTAAK
ncbi:MAG: TRAP transporter substrate-binding protein DctP [Desulfobulbaceae bacterium]|nr:TRAP transporter substrate-binding protein DctP [Desulfobulbaceae bacterium]